MIENGYYDGAYYLLGYAIECALKSCIAKLFKEHDFPDKKLVNDSYTHDLSTLFKISNLMTHFSEARVLNKDLDLNWTTVKDWSEQLRYQYNITQTRVQDFFVAVTDKKSGVLTWIKQYM